MQHQTVGSGQTGHLEDVVEEGSGLRSLVRSVVYWGILALGFVVPIAGAFWGIIH